MHSVMKIAVCLMLATIIAAKPNSIDIQGEQSLVRLFIDTRSLDVTPQARMSCFDQYSPILANLTNNWQNTHSTCLNTAESARTELDKSTVKDRSKIETETKDSCNAIAACKENEHSMEYFTCTDGAGKNNTETMYNISIQSEDVIARIKAKSIEIDQNEQYCTLDAERTYHDQQNKVYQQMTQCLNGKP